jgi:hypothetical protein
VGWGKGKNRQSIAETLKAVYFKILNDYSRFIGIFKSHLILLNISRLFF